MIGAVEVSGIWNGVCGSFSLRRTTPAFLRLSDLFRRRNILPRMNDAYLRSCHRGNDPLCPIFRLGDVVREAGEKFSVMAVEVGSPTWVLFIKFESVKCCWNILASRLTRQEAASLLLCELCVVLKRRNETDLTSTNRNKLSSVCV